MWYEVFPTREKHLQGCVALHLHVIIVMIIVMGCAPFTTDPFTTGPFTTRLVVKGSVIIIIIIIIIVFGIFIVFLGRG